MGLKSGQNGRRFFPAPRNFFARLSIHKRFASGHITHPGLHLAKKLKTFSRVDFEKDVAQILKKLKIDDF